MAVQKSRYRMVLRFLPLGLLVLALTACGPGSVAPVEEAEDHVPMEPKNLYILNCESCHGMDGKKGNSGAADLSASKLDDAAIKKMILEGNDKGMMPYKDIITSDEEVNSLVQYVKTLRK